MGQNCCSASENAPEIRLSHEDLSQETNQHQPVSHADRLKQANDVNQKQQFYGKNGDLYSKTITKEMSSNIDSNLEEYKQKIFSKQPTIHEQLEEGSLPHPSNPSKARRSKQERSRDIYDSYLSDLANQISARS